MLQKELERIFMGWVMTFNKTLPKAHRTRGLSAFLKEAAKTSHELCSTPNCDELLSSCCQAVSCPKFQSKLSSTKISKNNNVRRFCVGWITYSLSTDIRIFEKNRILNTHKASAGGDTSRLMVVSHLREPQTLLGF